MLLPGEIIIDSFAGGGGASEGIFRALGRHPDVAINHDPEAVAMHRANHPDTVHLCQSVYRADPRDVAGGRPVGLLWASPDCKHFSKAKGGQPINKNIRDLAWVVVHYAERVAPRIIILENVEEFRDWCDLVEKRDADGRPILRDGVPMMVPDPERKGQTFRAWVRRLRRLGYRVQWRELRACDYGAPTVRKRLFVIARRDGEPIVWPKPTHGDPKSPAVQAGKLKPWRTAAEIIDWSRPCPSIFDTAAEIKRQYGIWAKRPLAEATMARIAKGVIRYVIDAARPFLVSVAHGDSRSRRHYGIDEPLGAQAASQSHALVGPFVAPVTHAGDSRVNAIDEPLRTQTTAHRGEHAVFAPFVTKFNRGATGHAADEPLHTITAHASDHHGGGASPLGVVAPVLAGCGGRAAQSPPKPADVPLNTMTAKPDQILVTPFMVPRYGERPGQDPRARPATDPLATVVPTGNGDQLVAAHLGRQFGRSVGQAADEPAGTDTPGGGGKTQVVAAFLAQHNEGPRPGAPGRPVGAPVSTITTAGSQQSLVAAHLSHSYTSNTCGGQGDPRKPINTVTAGGNHAAAVYAFLQKYYGSGEPSQAVDEPMHTVTAKPRHGLVTVTIAGEPYVIVDIGMRMLTPRERFLAQGFRPDYVIDLEHEGKPLTLEAQGRMVGNSVCPPLAEALVAANVGTAAAAEAAE